MGHPDTRIVVGWTRYPSPEAIQAISEWPFTLAYVGADESAYFALLSHWWKSDVRNLVILEHDIIPKREIVREIIDCPREWCPVMYAFEQHWLYGLGLVKFGLEMRRHTAWLFDEIATMSGGPHHPPKHWCALDAHMQNLLHARSGEATHIHNPGDEFIEHRGTEGTGLNKWRSHAACLLG